MWIIILLIVIIAIPLVIESQYKKLEATALNELGFYIGMLFANMMK